MSGHWWRWSAWPPQRVRDQILRRMVPDQVAATRKR